MVILASLGSIFFFVSSSLSLSLSLYLCVWDVLDSFVGLNLSLFRSCCIGQCCYVPKEVREQHLCSIGGFEEILSSRFLADLFKPYISYEAAASKPCPMAISKHECSDNALQKGDAFCCTTDALAERSKAVAQGAIPKGRGFEPHRRHFDESKFKKFKMACSP